MIALIHFCQKSIVLKAIIFCILILTLPNFLVAQDTPVTPADENILDGEELVEGFILLISSKNQGDSFYKVYLDNEERPYIDIESMLKNWLELAPYCDVGEKICTTAIPAQNLSFWIDGLTKRYGDTRENKVGKPLPENSLAIIENKLWLRFDVWEDWLPVNVSWNLAQYKLVLLPTFATLSEVSKSRNKIRKEALERLRRRNQLDSTEPLQPEGWFRPELRYRLGYEQYAESEQKQARLDTDLNVDLWQGTLKLNQTNTVTEFNNENSEDSVTNWNYLRYNRSLFRLLELGNMVSDDSLLIPRMTIENGFKAHRLYGHRPKDSVNFSGLAPEGTEIDVYYAGFIIQSYTVGNEGIYQLDNIPIPGGEIVKVRFYYPDGSMEEKIAHIAADYGWLNPAKSWNSRLFSGDTEWGRLSKIDLAYGFSEDFTFGLQADQIEIEEEDPIDLAGAYLVWRPIYGIHLLAESLSSDFGSDYGAAIDITQFYPHYLRYEGHRLNELSPLLEILSGDKQTLEYDKVSYNLGLGRWVFLSDWIQTFEKTITESSLRYRLTGTISTSLAYYTEKIKESDQTQSVTLGGDYSTLKHALRVERTAADTPAQSAWSASYRYKSDNNQWLGTASIRIPDEGEEVFIATVTWKPTPRITTALKKHTNDQSAQVYWSDIFAPSPGPQLWENFGQGTLSGRILTPETEELPARPLAGVEVKAGSKKGITDDEGYFIIAGLPVEQRIEVSVNPGTLDIGLVPLREVYIVQFRPGTQIELNPELTHSVGVDGILDLGLPNYENVTIEVINIVNAKSLMTVAVEPDGFFVIEGLQPGQYELVVQNTNTPIKPYFLELNKGDVWVSEITITNNPEENK